MDKKSNTTSSLRMPLLIAIIGLFGTGFGAFIGGYLNIQLEKEKLRSNLILKAVETDNPKGALDFLKFLKETKLVEGLDVTIESWEKHPEAIPLRPMANLEEGIFNEDRSTRKKSLQKMIDEDANNPDQIIQVLESLKPENLEALTPQAKVNALFFLNKTNPAVWTIDMTANGLRILKDIETTLGPQALSELRKLKLKLSN